MNINEIESPILYASDIFEDTRGKLTFFNSLNLSNVKRMYVVENASVEILRAWQGHKIECKWFVVPKGKFEIYLIKLSDFDDPNSIEHRCRYELSSGNLMTLFVPGGYVSAIKALKENSKLIVFSDMDLRESKLDDFRFSKEQWQLWE